MRRGISGLILAGALIGGATTAPATAETLQGSAIGSSGSSSLFSNGGSSGMACAAVIPRPPGCDEKGIFTLLMELVVGVLGSDFTGSAASSK
ncbi:hypothetical protein [Nocardia sp. NPDC056000]|uniref:hypothetical protein n=1 Tax=Nocardia sp. NPDC056000 TaxID=3345674 RepID=UPI0035DE88EB